MHHAAWPPGTNDMSLSELQQDQYWDTVHRSTAPVHPPVRRLTAPVHQTAPIHPPVHRPAAPVCHTSRHRSPIHRPTAPAHHTPVHPTAPVYLPVHHPTTQSTITLSTSTCCTTSSRPQLHLHQQHTTNRSTSPVRHPTPYYIAQHDTTSSNTKTKPPNSTSTPFTGTNRSSSSTSTQVPVHYPPVPVHRSPVPVNRPPVPVHRPPVPVHRPQYQNIVQPHPCIVRQQNRIVHHGTPSSDTSLHRPAVGTHLFRSATSAIYCASLAICMALTASLAACFLSSRNLTTRAFSRRPRIACSGMLISPGQVLVGSCREKSGQLERGGRGRLGGGGYTSLIVACLHRLTIDQGSFSRWRNGGGRRQVCRSFVTFFIA